MTVYIKKIILLIIILTIPTVVLAASSEHRFMHNDHDTLIIGEITSIENEQLTVRVVDYIVSVKSMNPARKQLRPKTVTIPVSSFYTLDKLKTGDNLIASLDKKGQEFVMAHGAYKVDKTDYKTLKVEAYTPGDSAMFTDFVNSGGVYTEFIGDGSTGSVWRRHEKKCTLIYQNFMHNEHSLLIIGEITSIENLEINLFKNKEITIRVVDCIVKDMPPSRKQLCPETVTFTVDSFNKLENIKAGDILITSFDKNGEKFSVRSGAYKADKTDYRTLKVEDALQIKSLNYAPIFTDFINSGGVYTEFYILDDGSVWRRYEGNDTPIYFPETPIKPTEPANQITLNQIMTYLIYGFSIVVALLIIYAKKEKP